VCHRPVPCQVGSTSSGYFTKRARRGSAASLAASPRRAEGSGSARLAAAPPRLHPGAAARGPRLAGRRRNTEQSRRPTSREAGGRSAAWVGILLLAAALGCRAAPTAPGPRIHVAPAPDHAPERSCAWYGDARDGVLYFGVSAFWSALRAAGGDATADLRAPGPRWIGRFDLAAERFLPPLELASASAPTGVWDVLAHPNGRVYFTTYFDLAGSVDPASGEVRAFEAAGLGLNELALGPGGEVLVTRYGYGADTRGSVVRLSEAGEPLAEHRLRDPPGFRAAAKSLALDPLRRELWVNTDLFSTDEDGAVAHDARVLGLDGLERRVVVDPELQFFAFTREGAGFFAEAADGRLWLHERSPRGNRFHPLDDEFAETHDFVQEVRAEADGSVVVTRWSGRVHVLEPDGRVRDLALPAEDGSLYYTAVRTGARVCATRCGRVEVVCADLP
jgi:hypothetical protein